jgi:hypothetical protein
MEMAGYREWLASDAYSDQPMDDSPVNLIRKIYTAMILAKA